MSDPETGEENDEGEGTEDYDHLRSLMEMMKCKDIYHPKQRLAFDERTVVTTYGIEQKNGYTIDFKLYTSKTKMASGKGMPFDVVTGLVNKDHLGSGYIVYTDEHHTMQQKHMSRQRFQEEIAAHLIGVSPEKWPSEDPGC
ncbi:uncharacterized protein V6R79_011700 [Siganus canaliculatus]